MKKLKSVHFSFLVLVMVFLNSACQKVINLNLKHATPRIVIEGGVNNKMIQHRVRVSLTKPFSEDNSFVPVSNAVISIKENGGETYALSEDTNQPGNYYSEAFAGKVGKTYTLRVVANGKTYKAQSVMPQPVQLDSITATEVTFFNKNRKYIKVNFTDPPNVPNFYNYVIFVNDTLRNAYYVDSDRFNDGKTVSNPIFVADPALKTGDKITVDFQCIDEKIYRYFFALSQITGNGGPPTAPANPDSNLDNGALGYFSAHTSETHTVTLK